MLKDILLHMALVHGCMGACLHEGWQLKSLPHTGMALDMVLLTIYEMGLCTGSAQ